MGDDATASIRRPAKRREGRRQRASAPISQCAGGASAKCVPRRQRTGVLIHGGLTAGHGAWQAVGNRYRRIHGGGERRGALSKHLWRLAIIPARRLCPSAISIHQLGPASTRHLGTCTVGLYGAGDKSPRRQIRLADVGHDRGHDRLSSFRSRSAKGRQALEVLPFPAAQTARDDVHLLTANLVQSR